ncbi:TRAP transporter small permease [Acuticoccus sp. M5D2P5]|uniref:TRAP transporter small permease n=1 Tax=Acuticoccus kalidii TaxID=2910977 RepID=UPI001F336D3F|nr:TRAP transporter small permease [Acuticoccus kalidii]MCF3933159.1 TRAP transporter small permease [Acuticoccus kalidii]
MSRVEATIMVAAMATVVVVIMVQVVLRYVFNDSLSWAEELVRYTIVWMSFLGAGMGIARGAHIVMGLLVGILPASMSIWAIRLGHVGAMVFAVFLLVAGTEHVLTVKGFGQVSSAMRMPMWIVYLCLPLGALVFLMRLVEAMLRTFLPVEESPVHDEVLWTGGT